ncbi:MAG: FxsA family protein, partial [Verrucomicrobiota bacterium]
MFFRLLLLFIVVPAVELVLLIKIGSRIGLFPTLGMILVTGFLGAFLTKLQGA